MPCATYHIRLAIQYNLPLTATVHLYWITHATHWLSRWLKPRLGSPAVIISRVCNRTPYICSPPSVSHGFPQEAATGCPGAHWYNNPTWLASKMSQARNIIVEHHRLARACLLTLSQYLLLGLQAWMVHSNRLPLGCSTMPHDPLDWVVTG